MNREKIMVCQQFVCAQCARAFIKSISRRQLCFRISLFPSRSSILLFISSLPLSRTNYFISFFLGPAHSSVRSFCNGQWPEFERSKQSTTTATNEYGQKSALTQCVSNRAFHLRLSRRMSWSNRGERTTVRLRQDELYSELIAFALSNNCRCSGRSTSPKSRNYSNATNRSSFQFFHSFSTQQRSTTERWEFVYLSFSTTQNCNGNEIELSHQTTWCLNSMCLRSLAKNSHSWMRGWFKLDKHVPSSVDGTHIYE